MSGPCDFDIVLLAAGLSRRFGPSNKLLSEIDGVPLVRLVGERVRTALPNARLIAVTGHEAQLVETALAGVADAFIHNEDFASGIAGSVAAGVKATNASRGVMVVQGDMPGLDAPLLCRLADAFNASGAKAIVFPETADGRQRTPVIWPADLKGELLALEGDTGAKPLIARHRGRCRPVVTSDPRALADLDTPEALAAYLAARET